MHVCEYVRWVVLDRADRTRDSSEPLDEASPVRQRRADDHSLLGGRWRALAHPAFVASVAVLALNDHVLKARFPGWWTGKISDLGKDGSALGSPHPGDHRRRIAIRALLPFVVLLTLGLRLARSRWPS